MAFFATPTLRHMVTCIDYISGKISVGFSTFSAYCFPAHLEVFLELFGQNFLGHILRHELGFKDFFSP